MNPNKCIFEYSNFGNPYLKISIISNAGEASKEIIIDFKDYLIKDEIDVNSVVERIKIELNKIGIIKLPPILLLLRCYETYHTTTTLPIKNRFRANYFYHKDINTKINKELYQTVNNYYEYGNGYIFNTYCIPKKVVKAFSRVAKSLNTKVEQSKPFGVFFCDSLHYSGDYVYFYVARNVCTMMLISDNNLITSYDFEIEDSKTIWRNFLIVASKYEFEFQYKSITHYGIISDTPIELDLELKKL